MAQVSFFWQSEDNGSIEAGLCRLWLVAIPDRPSWAVYDGYTLVGVAPRTADDRTPAGQARLWDQVSALLVAKGKKLDDWVYKERA